jgi:hypothetical protein
MGAESAVNSLADDGVGLFGSWRFRHNLRSDERRKPEDKLLMKIVMQKINVSACAALLLIFSALPAPAQNFSAPPGPGGRNPVCMRLETQLSALDRGTADPARAEQIRRYEDAANNQQAELDKLVAQSRRLGCQGVGFFSLFGGQPPQCGQINNQIQQMRSNLDQILGTLQQLQGNTAGREGQRRSVLVALAENDCGPQYRTAAAPQQRGFFDTLFGPGTGPGSIMAPVEPSESSTFRTVCVRTCDGYFFPVSYSTSPSRFTEDERACQRMCPAAEVQLYTYRNPGEEISQAVSLHGHAYSDLPTAFAYRKEVNKACSCKRADQTWADALKQLDDNTIEQGDIVVTDERAKQLSQPKVDAQGKRIDPRTNRPAQTPAAAPGTTTSNEPTAASSEKRQVRTVGPTFVPAR